jgi:hypothetical protein
MVVWRCFNALWKIAPDDDNLCKIDFQNRAA